MVVYFLWKTQIKHNIHIYIYQNTKVHLEAILKYLPHPCIKHIVFVFDINA